MKEKLKSQEGHFYSLYRTSKVLKLLVTFALGLSK